MERGAAPALQQEFLDELARHLDGGGRVWFVTDGDYPISRTFTADDAPILRRSRMATQEIGFQRRALRVLYDRAEDVFCWDGPKNAYREPLTLILFDPGAKR